MNPTPTRNQREEALTRPANGAEWAFVTVFIGFRVNRLAASYPPVIRAYSTGLVQLRGLPLSQADSFGSGLSTRWVFKKVLSVG